jgi:intein/homing endonuclease
MSGEFQLKQGETLQGKDKLEFLKEVIKIRQDPVYFFSNIIYIDLFPKQEEIIRTFYQNKYNSSLLDYKKLIWISGQRCSVWSSFIETSSGIEVLKDLYPKGKNPIKDVPVKLSNVNVFNGEKFTPASDIIYAGKKEVYKITTEYGFVLECSEDHKFMTFNGEEFIWKALKDIKPDAFLQIHRNLKINGTNRLTESQKKKLIEYTNENKTLYTLPVEITPELTTVMGMWIADGSISNVGRMYFTKSDADLIKYYVNNVSHIFNIRCSIDKHSANDITKNVSSYCEQVRYFLEVVGLGHWYSDTKEIPSCVLKGTPELKKAFISGYFSCDGNAQVSKSNDSKKARVTSTTVSKTLAYQLQNLLLELGILSSISIGKSVEYGTRIKRENDAYTINIFGEEILNFYNTIRLISERKQKKLQEAYEYQKNLKSNGRKVPLSKHLAKTYYIYNPGIEGPWRGRGKTFCIDNQWDYYKGGSEVIDYLSNPDILFLKVKSIENLHKSEDMYDLHVPEGNAYLANGILVHNSGKSFIGAGMMMYEFHELLSYSNPHAHYNVGLNNRGHPAKNIGVTCVSTSTTQANDNIWGMTIGYYYESEYFQQWFSDSVKFNRSEQRLDCLDKKLYCRVAAPKIDTAAGYENKFVVYDEFDLMQFGATSSKTDTKGSKIAAHNVYSKINNSTQTFGSAGKIAVISSLQRNDGMMKLVYRNSKTEPETYAIETKTWEVNSDPELAEDVLYERHKNNLSDFYRDFCNMPEVGGNSFFPEGVRLNPQIQNNLMSLDLLPEGYHFPHVMSIDPAATNDSFGVACGFMADATIFIDGARKFYKPLSKDSYIKPSDIQNFINEQIPRLQVYAFIADTKQYPTILEDVQEKWGIDPLQSFADGKSYNTWRELQNPNPLTPPKYKLEITYDTDLEEECNNLVKVFRGVKEVPNVDHPYRGSKDTADAVCNCIWYLAENPEVEPYIPYSTVMII